LHQFLDYGLELITALRASQERENVLRDALMPFALAFKTGTGTHLAFTVEQCLAAKSAYFLFWRSPMPSENAMKLARELFPVSASLADRGNDLAQEHMQEVATMIDEAVKFLVTMCKICERHVYFERADQEQLAGWLPKEAR
jgi:hypothetical protein